MAKKQTLQIVTCAACRHSELHQWYKNPIICICSAKKGERFVAHCPMTCALYKEANSEKIITHHDKYD